MIKEFLDKASAAYYTGNPILSDEEFDFLAKKHNYNVVGFHSTDTVPHTYPLFSLQKCFDIHRPPFPVKSDEVVKTPKLDGAAVSILYIEGNLVLGLTRGDGKNGQDITDKIATLVPSTIPDHRILQITGEVVAPVTIENARNYAAGALNLKNLNEFKSRTLSFVAYDIVPSQHNLWSTEMTTLMEWGFSTVLFGDFSQIPQDGSVYRVDNLEHYYKLGFTSHHPRGAFALKEIKAGEETTLLDVIWQLGKSGVISPVAILEPVNVGGAVVTRATLHNMQYISDLNLEIGCRVEVIRAGEIIPRVVRRID